jgi:hypothetical protein
LVIVLVHWVKRDETRSVFFKLVRAAAVLNDVVAVRAGRHAEELSRETDGGLGTAAADHLAEAMEGEFDRLLPSGDRPTGEKVSRLC